MNFDTNFYQSKLFLAKPKISDLPKKQVDYVYNLLGIDDEIEKKTQLRILDEIKEDNLILVHYFHPEYSVSHIRGVIIYLGENPRIIAESFPFTDEIVLSEALSLSEDFFEHSIITKAYEGTIIRAFQGPETKKWYLSTHRKIDGRKSRWSGPTFGHIFDNLWGTEEDKPYIEYMNEKECYIFLLYHPENKLVCNINSPSIKLIGKMVPGEEGKMIPQLSDSPELCLKQEHPNVPVQKNLEIKNREDLVEELKNVNLKETLGLIVYDKKIKRCFKLVSDDYFIKRAVRGNEPNLKLRYIQFKFEAEEGQDPQQLRDLFPEKCEMFDEVDSNYKKLSSYLRKLYINRHQKKDFSIIPKEEHILTEKVRKNYDPKLSLIENLEKHLAMSTARQINAMIKHMLMK